MIIWMQCACGPCDEVWTYGFEVAQQPEEEFSGQVPCPHCGTARPLVPYEPPVRD